MIGGVTRQTLPHLTGVPHLHVDRPLKRPLALVFLFPAIRHFTNEKGSNWSRMGVFLRELLGMRWSAIGLTNLFPIYSPVPSNSPRSPCESKLGPVSSFLKWWIVFFSSVHTFFFLVFEQHVSRNWAKFGILGTIIQVPCKCSIPRLLGARATTTLIYTTHGSNLSCNKSDCCRLRKVVAEISE